MSKLILNVTYCDDIRHESSGKVSLIGCYADSLLTPELPARYAKLCVHFTIFSDRDFFLDKDLLFSVKQGEEQVAAAGIKADEVASLVQALRPVNDSNKVTLQGGVELSPFEIDSECILSSELQLGDETFEGKKLHVIKIERN